MKNSLKFIFFMMYLLSVFFVENLGVLASLFLVNLLGIKILKMSLKKLIHNLKILLPFVIFTAILNIIFGNLNTGILMAVRLFMAYQVTYIFSNSMTNVELANVIQNLSYPLRIFKINNEKIGLIVSIAFCVIPVLKNEIEQKKQAMKAKGAKIKLSNLLCMIEPIFISILKRTGEMEKSLKSKAYEE